MNYDVSRRTQQTYLEKYKQYQNAIDMYNAQIEQHRQNIDAYNAQVSAWNAGPRTSPFTGVQPTAPSDTAYKKAEEVATQANPRFTEAQIQQLADGAPPNLAAPEGGIIRTILNKSNQNMPTSIEGALANVRRST